MASSSNTSRIIHRNIFTRPAARAEQHSRVTHDPSANRAPKSHMTIHLRTDVQSQHKNYEENARSNEKPQILPKYGVGASICSSYIGAFSLLAIKGNRLFQATILSDDLSNNTWWPGRCLGALDRKTLLSSSLAGTDKNLKALITFVRIPFGIRRPPVWTAESLPLINKRISDKKI